MDPSHPLAAAVDIAVPATYVIAVVAMVGEFVALRLGGHPMHRRGGIASVLSGLGGFGGLALVNKLGVVALMLWLWEQRLVDLGVGPLAFGAGFLLYDLMFYVAHRAGHEIRLLWCFHSVHHTSEEMRLTSAIRGSIFDFVYLPWFFVWIPLLGVHPAVLLLVEVFGRIWGVLVHISPHYVGRLGPLEGLVITPSAHRVHHGRDEQYLDRNYGEVLTLWDHLLGTYFPEDAAPDYGVLKELDPGSFSEIQFSPWTDLVADLRRAPSLGIALRYLFDAPGYSHDGPDGRVRARR